MNPLKKLRAIDRKIRRQEKALEKIEHERAEFFVWYCENRPLKKEEQSKLTDHVESGGVLCCEDGAHYLSGIVPEIWAELINEWAYEKLDCCGSESNKSKAEKVRLLRRDMPPPGTPGYEIAKVIRNL
jgi:hypothetical protein